MSTLALVVDDSMLIRYTISRYLEDRGFAVESATNGEEALHVLSRVTPNLIFTDLKMPKMSGSEFITALKSKAETAAVPIIVVAGRESGLIESEKRADFVIYKDIEIDSQIAKALDQLLGKSNGAQAGK